MYTLWQSLKPALSFVRATTRSDSDSPAKYAQRATGMGAPLGNSSGVLACSRNDREAERVVNRGKAACSALGSQRVRAAVGAFPSGTWGGGV